MIKTGLKSKPLGCDESTLNWLEFCGVTEVDPKGLFGGEEWSPPGKGSEERIAPPQKKN